MSKLHELHELGQSTWLNYMQRDFIKSGEFRRAVREGVQGVTANAAVFAAAITDLDVYDEAIHQQVVAGTPYTQIHEALMIDDVQLAADILHPIYEESKGWDGFVSLELDPSLANNSVKTVAIAKHILAGMDRGNTMVEIPATMAGCEAIPALLADCESINITHIYTVTDFERAAQAYISGIERLLESHSMWRIRPTAVASFSVGAIDEAIDPLLTRAGRPDLRGKTGIALAKLLYQRFRQIFSGPRWERLEKRGARLLRPKWTRIEPHDLALPRTYYANALVGEDTILTFTPNTLHAFQAEGTAVETLAEDVVGARVHLANLSAAGIDLDEVVHGLQEKRLAEKQETYRKLVDAVNRKLFAGQRV